MSSRLKSDFSYVFLNNFICYVPIWHVRKFFYKIFGLKIDSDSRICMKTVIVNPRSIIIGKRTIINENCFIDGRGGLTIGNDVSISVYSKIVTASHKSYSSSFEYKTSKTVIEDNVWLGLGAIVLDNTYLSEGVIVSAGSVIKGKTEKYGIYTGNFASLTGKRNLKEKYELNYKPYFR